jgi:hypothetical protein
MKDFEFSSDIESLSDTSLSDVESLSDTSLSDVESNNKSKNNVNLFHKYKDFSLKNYYYPSPYEDEDDVRSLKSTSSNYVENNNLDNNIDNELLNLKDNSLNFENKDHLIWWNTKVKNEVKNKLIKSLYESKLF